jgi:exodeoxyribonuclease V beta subunit
LWLGFAAVNAYGSKDCKNHQSALGYLLGGPDGREAADWLQPLQAWASGSHGIALLPATDPTGVSRLVSRGPSPALQAVPDYRADFDRNWGIASYSRLTRDLKKDTPQAAAVSALSPLQVRRPADDESQGMSQTEDVAEVAASASLDAFGGGRVAPVQRLAAVAPAPALSPIWHSFKRGPITGNWLHQQLDWLSAEGFALQGNDGLAARLQARCERDGHKDTAPALVGWLTDVVNTPMPGLGAALAQLPTVRSEMEFWLPARQIETAAIDALCRQHLLPGVPRPRLQTSTLHGMLMGFMDLVFEHEGRYWVLDYKSNALGADDSAYNADSLAGAMAEHRYDVQAAIYGLALHRLLRSRLGAAYDPAQHLGGAVYLFLRGIHGPAGGTCTLSLPPECLDALDAMLDPAPETEA